MILVDQSGRKHLVYFFVVFAFCLFVCLDIVLTHRQLAIDLRSFYYASLTLKNGLNPYEVDALRSVADRSGISGPAYPYLYPPIFAFGFEALLRIPPPVVQKIWLLLGVEDSVSRSSFSLNSPISLICHPKALS
jgi:hypothetical protein